MIFHAFKRIQTEAVKSLSATSTKLSWAAWIWWRIQLKSNSNTERSQAKYLMALAWNAGFNCVLNSHKICESKMAPDHSPLLKIQDI
ncbi:hypothetical protein NPIL_341871 [Nephila pilipes]|uniref:Uncharacterized protein n=1 Tax=Nephila pilipes TaxID=299642 RepID=A0A8X6PYS9_NEPPI|nr:hypothetical protein NPIL_341871 [Nephila pilipes]